MDAARGATVRHELFHASQTHALQLPQALLRRNFLNSYGVWAFPPMVLQMTSLAVALAYGAASALVFAIAGEGVAVAAGPSGSPAALDASASLRSLVVLVGVGSGLIALLVLVRFVAGYQLRRERPSFPLSPFPADARPRRPSSTPSCST